jgi:hypothetical protein
MHKFTHTHIEHHKDGSATVHHKHAEGEHKDVKHAVSDLDGIHDSLEDHLGQPNPGEGQDEMGQAMPPAAGAMPAGA